VSMESPRQSAKHGLLLLLDLLRHFGVVEPDDGHLDISSTSSVRDTVLIMERIPNTIGKSDTYYN